ncbi:uncharacterized protein LOC129589202 [Paramacrobiotus metropolitanus]|uniref:uncharacterized protein LOC129589202 n=1 Tax=Paramacrobiotus metropolitanus TaxID=2943436 RepID=UPI002445DB51|nr:uncharacterized protein LOC129589202 [Paramacrobiotus metropolitanus]
MRTLTILRITYSFVILKSVILIVHIRESELAITVPATTTTRPVYAKFFLRRQGPRTDRQTSWDLTKCVYWTAFCNGNSNVEIYQEQVDNVGTYLCVPGDPPYAFGLNTYGQCNPYTFTGVAEVPTLVDVSGIDEVTVLCSNAANAPISGPLLAAEPSFSSILQLTQYQYQLVVGASSNGDFSPYYIAPDNEGGFLTTSTRPSLDTVQIITVMVQDQYTAFVSNPINITFVLKTCQLRIVGPSSFQVCNSLNQLTTIPNAQYSITPAPPGPATSTTGTTIVWNDPVLVSSSNGDTFSYLMAAQGGTYQLVATAPAVPATEVQVYNFTAIDSTSGTNYAEASRLITVVLNAGC